MSFGTSVARAFSLHALSCHKLMFVDEGSTSATSGTFHTSFISDWPHRDVRLTKLAVDWGIRCWRHGFASCWTHTCGQHMGQNQGCLSFMAKMMFGIRLHINARVEDGGRFWPVTWFSRADTCNTKIIAYIKNSPRN